MRGIAKNGNKWELILRSRIRFLGFFLAFLLLFLAGIGTSFTPCGYPVIPITVSIFGARGAETKMKAFLLSLTYAQGIGLMYGSLGLAAALGILGIEIAQPAVADRAHTAAAVAAHAFPEHLYQGIKPAAAGKGLEELLLLGLSPGGQLQSQGGIEIIVRTRAVQSARKLPGPVAVLRKQ